MLNIIKNVASLIAPYMEKARSITQVKVVYISERYFSPPKEKTEPLKSDLGFFTNSIHLKPMDSKAHVINLLLMRKLRLR